jgi:PAS domain S-box-containing protein
MTIPPNRKSTPQQGDVPAHTHIVQFSEDDTFLMTTVGKFLSDGLRVGEVCIVVATPAHRASLEQRLTVEGLDLTAAQTDGFFMVLDARETLARLLVQEQLEPARFFEVIGHLIERAGQGQRPVRIFGEMVALLWAEGKRTSALRLEELWNELGQRQAFSLFCTYPIQDMADQALEAEFTQLCQQHSHILPSESYTHLSEQERLRAFTLLQQKALALEVEIACRHAVQERLLMLAAIVESTDDAVLSKNLAGTITSWNRAAEHIYGYTAQEIIGQPVTLLFPPDRAGEFEQIMARIRQGERVEHHETRRMRKDGTILTVSVTISPVKNEAGEIIGASTIARDVTNQRLVEAKSQQLFASNLVGIFVADVEGTLLETNQALLDLLGYTRADELIGPLQPDTPLASLLRDLIFQASQSSGTVEPQETVLQQKHGKDVPVLVAMTCIEHTSTCIGFVLNISERKALEQRKDAFIGMASHELKTPLTSLKGFLGVLRRLLASQENEKILHALTRMDAQIDKLTTLINDLLDISRMQTGQLVYREERVEVDDLVQEMVESMQETTQTHHLQVEGQTQAAVFGDQDRLGQVLMNLLNNAIKYSPQADTVLIHLASDETQVHLRVQDFGVGIAPEHHDKVFERFYQVIDPEERTYPGLGIGLAISHDIVMRHGGRLWVESQKGEGSTFHLRFPLLPQKNRPGAEIQKEGTMGSKPC